MFKEVVEAFNWIFGRKNQESPSVAGEQESPTVAGEMEYFSIKEVAKICHCSTETIRRYIRNGKISKPFYGVGYTSGVIKMDAAHARAGHLLTQKQIDEILALLKRSQSGEALREGYVKWVQYGRREAEKKSAIDNTNDREDIKKEKKRKYAREYYRKNREKILAKQKKKRDAKSKQRAYNKRYYKANKEKMIKYTAEWRKNNPEKVKAYEKKRFATEKHKAWKREYMKTYKAKQKLKNAE